MRHNLISLALGLGVSARAVQDQWQECKFEVDSQNVGNARLASEFQTTTFILDAAAGTLNDAQGRVCSWDRQHKIDCQEHAKGSKGWAFETGELRHNGHGEFVACPCAQSKEWDIFKHPFKKDLKCEPVHLKGHCGRPSSQPPVIEQPQVGNTPAIAQCIRWCGPADWDCKKHCHSLEQAPPSVPSHPEKQTLSTPCNKCKPAQPCNKCKTQQLKPCTKCKPAQPCLKCKSQPLKSCKKCKPAELCNKCKAQPPKLCNKCKPAQLCNKCTKERVTEVAVACGDCPRRDFSCHKKCQGPKPPPCNKCHKKPACEKKCWEVPFTSSPPKPKGPLCCTQCDAWDGECWKTCYAPNPKDQRIEYWKPKHDVHHPRPVPCHKCHPKKPECHKACKPSPCHMCRPEHEACKKTCKKPDHLEPPFPWIKPWPQPGTDPKPFPPCCDQCKPKDQTCQGHCISRTNLERFVAKWETEVTPEIAEKLTTEQMFEKIQENLDDAITEKSASESELLADADQNKKQKAEEAERSGDEEDADADATKEPEDLSKRDEPARRVENSEAAEAADQCRCPEGDHRCFKKCIHGDNKKPIAACSDCKKSGCKFAKKCHPVVPKPCNVCHKDNRCKKSCFKPRPKPEPCKKCHQLGKLCGCKKPQPPPLKPCEKCHKKPCACKKSQPPALKPCQKCKELGKPCNKCNKPQPPALKPCEKCHKKPCACSKPPPTPFKTCSECHKKPCGCKKLQPLPPKPCNKCHKKPCGCNKPPVPMPAPKPEPCKICHKFPCECHKPQPPAPVKPCCNKCQKADKSCFAKCNKKCKPYPPPPAPPKPAPRPCDECPFKDFGCLETCFLKPNAVPNDKTKCCIEGCKEDDWSCKKKCWEAQHGKPVPPPPGPPVHGNHSHGHGTLPPASPSAGNSTKGWNAPSGAPGKPPGKPTSATPGSASPVYNAPVGNKAPPAGQPFGICPANLDGDHVFPGKVQPISTNPHAKIVDSSAEINPTTSSVFTFDLPKSFAGKTCSLFFYYPAESAAKSNAKGSASFDLTTKPGKGSSAPVHKFKHLNDVPLRKGTTYWIKDHACVPGELNIEVSSIGGFELSFPEHQKVGLFVRAC